MRHTTRTNNPRTRLSVRELREYHITEGGIMSGPYRNIDMKLCQDSFGGYYNAIDLAGRPWRITNFSLSGIWVMWPPKNSQREPIYVRSLQEADTILGGGVVKDQEIKKPERVFVKNQYDKIADYRIDLAKQEADKKHFDERQKRRALGID